MPLSHFVVGPMVELSLCSSSTQFVLFGSGTLVRGHVGRFYTAYYLYHDMSYGINY